MIEVPEVKYVRVNDYHLAYQVFGSGPPDLLFLRTGLNHIELQWEEPKFAALLRGLASFGRVIVHDKRGHGLSDPFPPTWHDLPPNEVRAQVELEDVLAVMDRLAVGEAIVIAESASAFCAAHLAASHPERVMAAVFCNPYAFGDQELRRSDFTDDPAILKGAAPDLKRWLLRYVRASLNRATLKSAQKHSVESDYLDEPDARPLLPAVRVPALVVKVKDGVHAGQAEDVKKLLPDARLVSVPGVAPLGWRFDDPEAVVAVIEEFVTGEKRAPRADRVLATILFTDVVESTSMAAEIGDRRWTSTLDSLDDFTFRQVDRFGGKRIKSTGDGHLVTFDSPGRAILCACALRDGVDRFGIEIRAGLHVGEVEVRGQDIGGLAVSIARRVCDKGAAGEVLVSGAIPQLVAGSGFEFEDRGEHGLRGVPGRWHLYAVRA